MTYGLGIYNLNLLIGFLTPRNDMDSEGPQLPTTNDQEFRPFIRILPEFKFWQVSQSRSIKKPTDCSSRPVAYMMTCVLSNNNYINFLSLLSP